MPPTTLAIPAAVVPCGGLPSLPPAYPAFGLLFCPLSPQPPSPVGKGGFFVFLCKGLRPLHPRHLTACGTYRTCQAGAQRGLAPGGTGCSCRCGVRRGACPLCRSPTLPLVCLFAPLPRRGRIDPQPPSPAGKGETFTLFRRGLRPRHPCIKPFAALTVSSIRAPRARAPAVRCKNVRKRFPMSGAGSQGEGGPGERNFGV